MTTARVNLAAVAVLAAAWISVPLAFVSAEPEPATPIEGPVLSFAPPGALWTSPDLDIAVEGYTPPPEIQPPPPEPESARVLAPSIEATKARPPVAVGSVRSRALGELARLGAPQWVIGGFDCIGRNESGWRSVTGGPNYNGTYDHGPLQFNDVHWPRLNRLGLDPYVPEHAARFAMVLYRESGFGPWSATRWRCGV